jgi:predicted transcriptional regulator with HTH domain
MQKMKIENAEELSKMKEEFQQKTQIMTKDHNKNMEHINSKMEITKAVISKMQDDHEDMFNEMKMKYETEKSEIEETLRRKKQKLIIELFQINEERKNMDQKFESQDQSMELQCVDDYLKMNWKNDKGRHNFRNQRIGKHQDGNEVKGGERQDQV